MPKVTLEHLPGFLFALGHASATPPKDTSTPARVGSEDNVLQEIGRLTARGYGINDIRFISDKDLKKVSIGLE